MIKIFGHTFPDTDSTGSPIIWAWYLNEVRRMPAKAVLQGEPNSEAKWMLQRWNVAQPEIIETLEAGDKCVIVDTNNPAELPENIEEAEVVEIIDHHLLAGGITTILPINITMRPLACTATIMHDLIGDDLARAPESIKAIMLTCILSDTLEFRSPTTTPHDQAVAEKLAAEVGVDISEYAGEMFAAKSDVSAFSDEELLRLDSKEYELSEKKLRITVLETTAPQVILARKESLMAAMPAVVAADEIDEILLFVVDILREEATLLIQNDRVKSIAEKSFDVTVNGDSIVLPGVMSRKKQIIPVLDLG